MSSVAKKKMEQPFECKFCGTKFHKETTLHTHMCVKKRRHLDISATGPRFGFTSYQRFYELTTKSKKPKSQQEFIDSPYYIDFVKFGNHLALLKPVYIDKYIDFVILNGVKLKDWTKDSVYELYIEDLSKKEPAISAAERSIVAMMDWCDKNSAEFANFFSAVSANECAHLIQTGRISPWVLYLSASGDNIMSRFTEDHSKMIGNIIEPGVWMKKFKKTPDDVEYIRNLLDQVGL